MIETFCMLFKGMGILPRLLLPSRRRFLLLFPSSFHSLFSLSAGVIFGFLICSILFGGDEENETMRGSIWRAKDGQETEQKNNIQMAEHWQRRLVGGGGGAQQRGMANEQSQQQPKISRARFAASELGIRDRILLLPLIRSPIGLSLHRWLLSPHFPPPSLRPIVDSARVDPSGLPDSIPLRPGDLSTPTHLQLLNAIANLTLQHKFDWFLLFPDRTFVNPFQLRRLLSTLQWYLPLALGHQKANSEGLCHMEAGILLSNPAMRQLAESRHICQGIVAQSLESAVEKCVRLTTNLSCQSQAQGVHYHWSPVPSDNNGSSLGASLHDQIPRLASIPGSSFNSSLTISPLLTDSDIKSLLEHFLRTEIGQMDGEIEELEGELIAEFGQEEEVGWPIGSVDEGPAPNRFQVPVCEMFIGDDPKKLFGNDPDRNMEELDEEGTEELKEVIQMARKKVAEEQQLGVLGTRIGRVRQGYRRFCPERGMEYLVDLEWHHKNSQAVAGIIRVQIVRPFHATILLDKMPFVKEDTDITIVVPIDSLGQVPSLRSLLHHQSRLCSSSSPRRSSGSSSSNNRFVVTARSLEASIIRFLGSDLIELKRKCGHWLSDSALLLLQPDPIGQLPLQIAAMDATVDHYGHQTLFLLISPFADFQRDFLDRVRLNTIQNFQVFFPIPFAEFNPYITGLSPTKLGDFVVHKDRGRFDTEEFGVSSFYGSDYASARSNHALLHPASSPPSDLVQLFLPSAHHLHLMRPIDPSLLIRYHPRVCPAGKEMEKCERNRRDGMGTRAQLAKLIFANEDQRMINAEGMNKGGPWRGQ